MRSCLKREFFGKFAKIRGDFDDFFDVFLKMATGKFEVIGYIFVWGANI